MKDKRLFELSLLALYVITNFLLALNVLFTMTSLGDLTMRLAIIGCVNIILLLGGYAIYHDIGEELEKEVKASACYPRTS